MGKVKCPNCSEEAEYEDNEFRPFCSERCKMIDFGAWADGEYALPAVASSLSEENLSQIEKALEDKVVN